MLTCHEPVYMEKGHDYQGLVLWAELIGGDDVGETGGQVALAQWHSLHRPKRGGGGGRCRPQNDSGMVSCRRRLPDTEGGVEFPRAALSDE